MNVKTSSKNTYFSIPYLCVCKYTLGSAHTRKRKNLPHQWDGLESLCRGICDREEFHTVLGLLSYSVTHHKKVLHVCQFHCKFKY